MRRAARNSVIGLACAVVLLIAGATIYRLMRPSHSGGQSRNAAAIPVEVSAAVTGSIAEHKTFSATLEASAEVVISSKIQGRVQQFIPDLGDEITRGQLIAELDSAEFQQDVLQARAELAVADAQLIEAQNAAKIADRELTRVSALHERGIASDAALDTATTQQLTSDASVKVAEAQVERARALVEAAQIRLGYASIRADWEGQGNTRVVSDRYVEEGDTIGANTAMLAIVELDPIDAVIHVTERDYPVLAPGLEVTLTTDAFPSREWKGSVSRVSPVFREGSRQARVEIRVANEDLALKPGMFARIDTILRSVDEATVVPAAALTRRENTDVVFVLEPGTMTVSQRPVTVGIRDGENVQVIGNELRGVRVVTLGQHLLDDGAAVSLPTQTEGEGAGER